MNFKNLFFVALLSFPACHFDEQRQFDLQFPGNLIVINESEETVRVDSIYNSNDTRAGFVLKGFKLKPNGEEGIRISRETLSALKSREGEFKGKCATGDEWYIRPQEFSHTMVSELTIRIVIDPCSH